MKRFLTILLAVLLIICLSSCALTQWHHTWRDNKVDYIDQKIDDATRYETRKTVEDSCRAMVASYEADKLTWEQYKDSDSDEERSWANQAKMRANRTASNYNNYVLKNSYVWGGNVPADIRAELPLLK